MPNKHLYRILFTILMVVSFHAMATFTNAGVSAAGTGYEIKLDLNVRIPMRDGAILSADIYRPDTAGKFPVILLRTPYSNNSKRILDNGLYFAEHGFVFIAQDSRGRHDSEGRFRPFVDEGRDGYDTIEWAAKQPWSNGNVGTIGGSYAGWNQWFAAVEGSEHLKTMVSIVTPPDPFLNVPYQNGAFLLGMADWMILVDARVNQELSMYDLPMLYKHLPVITMDEAAGRRVPWWREWTEHNSYDEYWKERSYQDKYDRVNVPVLHVTGWYDDDQVGALLNYAGMIKHGRSLEARRGQWLLIGPWPHAINSAQILGDIDFGPEAVIDINDVYRRWFDCHLREKGCDQVMKAAPVRIFVMGENRWRDEQEWPLSRAKFTRFYFHSQGQANTLNGDGTLSTTAPANEPSDRFSYDPSDPVPTVFVPGSFQLESTEDQRPIETRNDVLVYTSEPITEALEVTGRVRVRLWAATSAPDTDWSAKLIDVHPDGYAQRLLGGVIRARFRNSYEMPVRLKPGKPYEYEIDLWATSHVFKEKHRIRVEISSSNFPKFNRNLNTGKNNGTSMEMQMADQKIFHDAKYPSHIILPVVPRPR